MSWEVRIGYKTFFDENPWARVPEEAQVHWDRDVAPLLGAMPPNITLRMKVSQLTGVDVIVSVDFVGWDADGTRDRAVCWFENHLQWGQHWSPSYYGVAGLEEELGGGA